MILNKKNKYGIINNYDLFKILAFITMVIDHTGMLMFPYNNFIRLIGRISMPIFIILFGYSYKSKNNKFNVLLFAIIMSCIGYLFKESMLVIPLNVLYTIFISGFLLEPLYYLYENNIFYFFIVFLLLLIGTIVTFIFLDYGFIILLIAFCGKIFKKEQKTITDEIFTIIIFVLYFLFGTYCFRFNILYSIIFLLILINIYNRFYNFKIKHIENSRFLNKLKNWQIDILLFISRNTLIFYILHILLILIIKNYIK